MQLIQRVIRLSRVEARESSTPQVHLSHKLSLPRSSCQTATSRVLPHCTHFLAASHVC